MYFLNIISAGFSCLRIHIRNQREKGLRSALVLAFSDLGKENEKLQDIHYFLLIFTYKEIGDVF